MVLFHDLTKKINMRGMNEEGRGCCCCRMGMKVASDVVFEFWTAFPSPNVDGGRCEKGPTSFSVVQDKLVCPSLPFFFFPLPLSPRSPPHFNVMMEMMGTSSE